MAKRATKAKQGSGTSVDKRGDGRKPNACDLVVRNAYVLTLNAERTIYASGAIAITGNSIVAVGPEREVLAAYRGNRVIDAHGAPVHPGFIDAHNHVVHITGRGVFDEIHAAEQKVNFADWKASVTDEDEFVSGQLAFVEMIRNGFTMFVEPGTVFEPDAVAAAAESVGIRGAVAEPYLWDQVEVMDHVASLKSQSLLDRAPPTLERGLDLLGSQLWRNKDPDALVHGYISLYGEMTASDELELAAKKIADENGVVFQQHLGYMPSIASAEKQRLGHSQVTHLAELGVLDENSTLIHMYALYDEDEQTILDSKLSIVWCPNMYLLLGISDDAQLRLPDLYHRGVNCAIGTDALLDVAAGDAGSIASLVARDASLPLSWGNMLEMQTICGARSIGLGDLTGSLEPGKRADLVIRTADAPETHPMTNPLHQLAFTRGAGIVDTVIVDGQIVSRHGHATQVDEGVVFAEARACVERRMNRLGLRTGGHWPVVA